MLMQMTAWIASLLVFFAFFMKTMIPLRVVAIVSNVAFISYSLLGLHYGIFEKVYPIFVLHSSLLPLNIIRLYKTMNEEKKKIAEAAANEPSVEYLTPFMHEPDVGRVIPTPRVVARRAQGVVLGALDDLALPYHASPSPRCGIVDESADHPARIPSPL